MVNTMFNNKMNLADWLTEASGRTRTSLVFIAGESGVGKTFLADALAKRIKGRFIDVDSFGSHQKVAKADGTTTTKWMIDTTELVRTLIEHEEIHIVCGYSDNLVEVFKALAVEFALSIYVVRPGRSLFKRILGAKITEGVKKRLPQHWIEGWLTRSKLSVPKLSSKLEESERGIMLAVAAGLQDVADGGVKFEPPIPRLEPSQKFWNWVEQLLPRVFEIEKVVDANLVSCGIVLNDADPKVEVTTGWHVSENEYKPKFTK